MGFVVVLEMLSGKEDAFMDEIPTFVAQPLADGIDQVLLLLTSTISLFIEFMFSGGR